MYHLLGTEDNNVNSIRRAFRGFPMYPFVCILTSLPELPARNRSEVSDDFLRTAAMNTSRLLIGAYDGESYLTWLPP